MVAPPAIGDITYCFGTLELVVGLVAPKNRAGADRE